MTKVICIIKLLQISKVIHYYNYFKILIDFFYKTCLMKFYLGLAFLLLSICSSIQAQEDKSLKVDSIFLNYVSGKLNLTTIERAEISPLINNYLIRIRGISKHTNDQLIRSKKIIDLKLRLRSGLIPLIGDKRANDFFNLERMFRRQISDELNKRRNNNREDEKKYSEK
jgi:hypothetical protein